MTKFLAHCFSFELCGYCCYPCGQAATVPIVAVCAMAVVHCPIPVLKNSILYTKFSSLAVVSHYSRCR
jgi:hypothetical protein